MKKGGKGERAFRVVSVLDKCDCTCPISHAGCTEVRGPHMQGWLPGGCTCAQLGQDTLQPGLHGSSTKLHSPARTCLAAARMQPISPGWSEACRGTEKQQRWSPWAEQHAMAASLHRPGTAFQL